MMNDLIADMLTRIRNAQKAKLAQTRCPYSKFSANVLQVMQNEGYIRGFEKQSVRNGIDELVISLKYVDNRKPVIKEIVKVSKSGRREYISASEAGNFYNNLGIAILSTSRGVISNIEALKHNVGGELICKIF
jgi:small subunit ribosomal protein S8